MTYSEKKPSELAELQADMFSWLLAEDDAIKLHIAKAGRPPQQVNTDSVSERLKIYSNAYRFRLIDALSDTFPSVHTLMGDDAFYEMSNGYIDAFPSRHFSLRYFGNHLSAFLNDYQHQLPVLAEMAEFEWSLRNSFDSKDIQPISLQVLQAVPAEEFGTISFCFHPSVRRLNLEWNTPQLWAAIDEEADPIAPHKHEIPYSWVLWRKELLTYYRSLEVDEAWALDEAMNGCNFAYLCEGVCEWVDEMNAPARVAGFVSQWIEDGLVVEI